jgi:hypothetical protein
MKNKNNRVPAVAASTSRDQEGTPTPTANTSVSNNPSNQPPMDCKIETREPHQNDESLLLLKRDELELQTKWSYAKKKKKRAARMRGRTVC